MCRNVSKHILYNQLLSDGVLSIYTEYFTIVRKKSNIILAFFMSSSENISLRGQGLPTALTALIFRGAAKGHVMTISPQPGPLELLYRFSDAVDRQRPEATAGCF